MNLREVKEMQRKTLLVGVSLLAAAGCASVATGPQAIDWNKIPATTVAMFYPGQSSYQWLRSEGHKGAAKETQRGDACTSCHDDAKEEQLQGSKILRGNHPLEPQAAALKGKAGHVDVKVQAAYDDKNAYLRFEWKTGQKHPGNDYPGYRFDGKEWKAYGHMRLEPNVLAGKTPAIYENRMSIMLDDGKVPGFAAQGCWQTCHDSERDMPKAPSKDQVAANPLLGSALKKSDVRKYVPASRNDVNDWRSGKSLDEIARLKADGQFLELMQWRAHRSNNVGAADDGYVLEYRNFDKGVNPFNSNMDGKTKQPKYMFDAAKFGSKAMAAGDYGKKEMILVKGMNAVPFDPNAGWKEGDILPQYVLSAEDSKGSAADNKAIGSWKDGVQTVVFIRPLGLANDDDKALKAGGVYNVGFAVHDDNMTGRGHFVSYVKTLGLGAKADIQAVKLD